VGAAGGRSLRGQGASCWPGGPPRGLRRDWGSGGRPGRTAKPRVKRRTGDDGGAAEATTTVWTAKKVGGSAATEPLGGWEGRPVPLPIGRMDWWNGRASGGGQGIVYAPDRNRRAEGKGAVVKTAQTGSRRISANIGAAP